MTRMLLMNCDSSVIQHRYCIDWEAHNPSANRPFLRPNSKKTNKFCHRTGLLRYIALSVGLTNKNKTTSLLEYQYLWKNWFSPIIFSTQVEIKQLFFSKRQFTHNAASFTFLVSSIEEFYITKCVNSDVFCLCVN